MNEIRQRDAALRSWSGRLALLLILTAALLGVTGCGKRATPPGAGAPSSEAAAPAPEGLLPARNTSAVIHPDAGGVLALSEGARVTFPRQSVTASTVANLRVVSDPPPAPLPRSILGESYEFTVEDGGLAGVALVSLPLPPKVDPASYELGAFRWNGRAWERVGGRVEADGVEFGSNVPALYSIQGRWRPAEARLGLATMMTDTLRATVPISVTGYYRYSAPPQARADGFVPAQLTLKRDSSGGAGQVTGNPALDETVAQAPLLFQPEPAMAEGTVDFGYLFEVAPGALRLPPGETARLYAILAVEDSAAPTQATSPAVEYVQVFPIQIVDGEVVRPLVANEDQMPLRWHVQLNGETLSEPEADVTLPLEPVLAQGGVGEYRITLEARVGEEWKPASNTVSVTLALPGVPTPAGGEPGLAGGGTPIAMVPGGVPTPTETPPAVPTRRNPPAQPTFTPSPTITPTETFLTPTPTPAERPDWASIFWADAYTVPPGGCTTLHWNVQNVEEVYLNGVGVTGQSSQTVCPDATTTYTLRSVSQGVSQDWYVTIKVEQASEAAFEFTTDAYEIINGACTTLRWRANNVLGVYLNGEGVAGESTRQVCPTVTTVYELLVEDLNGALSHKNVTINVAGSDEVLVRFWADQYTMNPSACTTLRWNVESVQAVYLDTPDGERGVPGVSQEQVCPTGDVSYTLTATTADGRSGSKTISLDVGQPTLGANEVIAQGVVRAVTRNNDIDPASAGDQPGYSLVVDGMNPLYRGPGDCCQAAATLQLLSNYTGGSQSVDWPISSGQWVEFRAVCTNSTCTFQQGTPFYLRLRSN